MKAFERVGEVLGLAVSWQDDRRKEVKTESGDTPCRHRVRRRAQRTVGRIRDPDGDRRRPEHTLRALHFVWMAIVTLRGADYTAIYDLRAASPWHLNRQLPGIWEVRQTYIVWQCDPQ